MLTDEKPPQAPPWGRVVPRDHAEVSDLRRVWGAAAGTRGVRAGAGAAALAGADHDSGQFKRTEREAGVLAAHG
jgi:hypothetical protein